MRNSDNTQHSTVSLLNPFFIDQYSLRTTPSHKMRNVRLSNISRLNAKNSHRRMTNNNPPPANANGQSAGATNADASAAAQEKNVVQKLKDWYKNGGIFSRVATSLAVFYAGGIVLQSVKHEAAKIYGFSILNDNSSANGKKYSIVVENLNETYLQHKFKLTSMMHKTTAMAKSKGQPAAKQSSAPFGEYSYY